MDVLSISDDGKIVITAKGENELIIFKYPVNIVTLQELSPGNEAIKCNWVYTLNRNKEGFTTKEHSRLLLDMKIYD